MVVVVLFVFLSATLYFLGSNVRGIFYSTAKPVWKAEEVLLKPFSFIFNFFQTKNSLIAENIFLKDENSSLRLKVTDYENLTSENNDLKNQLGRIDNADKIISRILSKPPFSPYDTFVIDAGERDSVSVGSKVFISDSIVIGTVKSVTGSTSLVELFSSGGFKHEFILLRTGLSLTLEGQGGGNFKIEVPKDTDVVWGDTFVYPGLSSQIVGNVYFVETNDQSSFKTIYLRTPLNVFGSKYVFIEKASI